jgi:hypothetical protein
MKLTEEQRKAMNTLLTDTPSEYYNSLIPIAERVLDSHGLSTLFSYRHAFILGWLACMVTWLVREAQE